MFGRATCAMESRARRQLLHFLTPELSAHGNDFRGLVISSNTISTRELSIPSQKRMLSPPIF